MQLINSWGPQRVITEAGQVSGLELVRCTEVFDDTGRFAPQYNPQEIMQVSADSVLLAVGQRPETSYLPEAILRRGWIGAEDASGATGIQGVYAAGDAVRTANVIDAIAGAKHSAAAMHLALTGQAYPMPEREERFLSFDPRSPLLTERVFVPFIPLQVRTIDPEDRVQPAAGTV